MRRLRWRCSIAGLVPVVLAMLWPALSRAENENAFPQRPMRIIVAGSVGSADDFFARTLADELERYYRQRILVDSRAGAGGLIGNTLVSKANPDGHTMGMISVTRLITALMREQPPYRPLADITGVAHVASITNVLTVTPNILIASASEFVRYARARPGDLNYASLGIGSASHLAGAVFSRALGIQAVHIPFRAVTNTFVEMGLGRVHYAVLTLPAVAAPLREGRLQALAVMTARRSDTLPAVPAITEVGLPDAQFDSWSGIVVPQGTPRRIVEQLHGDILHALRTPALRKRFEVQGSVSVPDGTPDGFMRLMQEEYIRFAAIIREGSVRPE
jgi:tripartite-type tricarboxylate transporter receptor subunit TctC